MTRKWTKETILQEGRKYSSRIEWKNNSSGSYSIAGRNKWLDEACAHMMPFIKKKMWTKEKCLEEAKKYQTIKEFSKNANGAYQICVRDGYKEAFSHMTKADRTRKWTKEKSFEEARKYKHRSEFLKAVPGCYEALVKYGLLDEACAHMTVLWEKKWDAETALAEIKKYKTLREAKNKSASAYNACVRLNLIEGLKTVPHRKAWTKEQCHSVALKYKTRSEFAKNDGGAYNAAFKRGWLDEVCSHMSYGAMWLGVQYIHRYLIAREVKYIAEKRFKEESDVARYAFDFYLPDQNIIIEHHGTQHLIGWYGKGHKGDDLKAIQNRDEIKRSWAKVKGIFYIEIGNWEYKTENDLITLLDKRINNFVAGFKPQIRKLTEEEIEKIASRIKWTKEACHIEALKYETRADFFAQSLSAYSAANRRGWLDDICSHMVLQRNPNDTWKTKEACMAEAKKYRFKTQFLKEASGCAWACRVNGWYQEVTAHMEDGRKLSIEKNRKWTKDACIEAAKKYSSRSTFAKGNGSAWNAARVNGWLDEVCAHMKLKIDHGKWSTFDVCKKEAEKYFTRSEFNKKAPGAYASAKKNGWSEDICSHMPQVPNWSSKDTVAKEASKYQKRSQFENGSPGAYNVARKNRWLDEFFPKK
jgi:hypothetical protein